MQVVVLWCYYMTSEHFARTRQCGFQGGKYYTGTEMKINVFIFMYVFPCDDHSLSVVIKNAKRKRLFVNFEMIAINI